MYILYILYIYFIYIFYIYILYICFIYKIYDLHVSPKCPGNVNKAAAHGAPHIVVYVLTQHPNNRADVAFYLRGGFTEITFKITYFIFLFIYIYSGPTQTNTTSTRKE